MDEGPLPLRDMLMLVVLEIIIVIGAYFDHQTHDLRAIGVGVLDPLVFLAFFVFIMFYYTTRLRERWYYHSKQMVSPQFCLPIRDNEPAIVFPAPEHSDAGKTDRVGLTLGAWRVGMSNPKLSVFENALVIAPLAMVRSMPGGYVLNMSSPRLYIGDDIYDLSPWIVERLKSSKYYVHGKTPVYCSQQLDWTRWATKSNTGGWVMQPPEKGYDELGEAAKNRAINDLRRHSQELREMLDNPVDDKNSGGIINDRI